MAHQFDSTVRSGPKAFVSEYAVTGKDAGKGSLLAALAEAAFLIGIEQNSDVVEMASYAPLFVNTNNRRWSPDAIVFDSWQSYGTPSYWVQQLFKDSSGSDLLPTSIRGDAVSSVLAASAVQRFNFTSFSQFIDIKVVNFGGQNVTLHISINGFLLGEINSDATVTRLASQNAMDENSFSEKKKIQPDTKILHNAGAFMETDLPARSFSVISLELIIPFQQVM